MTNLAVIGTGHLGKIHLKLAKQIESFQLIGFVDSCAETRAAVTTAQDVPGFASLAELPNNLEAAIISASTAAHYDLAKQLLNQGVHVFLEKPITVSVEQADELIQLANEKKCILQVGHVERFNPAFEAIAQHVVQPRYIETRRYSTYTFRSTEVGVVLDLLIHDLDLILSLVSSTVTTVEAIGFSVFGNHEDMVQARIAFANGTVANVNASRCSFSAERSMQIFASNGWHHVDFGEKTASQIIPKPELANRSLQLDTISPSQQAEIREQLFTEYLPKKELTVHDSNAILEEQRDFYTAISTNSSPRVTGQAGREALALAHQIIEQVNAYRQNQT